MSEKKEIFKVQVNDDMCPVYDIKGKEHEYGKANGEPTTWWIEVNGALHPFPNRSVHRPCFAVEIVEKNHTKTKWDDLRISGGCSAVIKCNGKVVYEFSARDIQYALTHAAELVYKIGEHPFCFWEAEKEIGRKIFYHNQPAVIKRLILDQGCVMIEHSEPDGKFDLKHPWDKKDDIPNEWDGAHEVKDDVFSENIWWFRED